MCERGGDGLTAAQRRRRILIAGEYGLRLSRGGPRYIIERPADPAEALVILAIEAGRLPDRHAHVVRSVRVRIPHSLHDRQAATLQQSGRLAQRWVQTHRVVDLDQLVGSDAELATAAGITLIAIRHDGIDAVVAAIELNDDQHAGVPRIEGV